jgi:hypothetical protein
LLFATVARYVLALIASPPVGVVLGSAWLHFYQLWNTWKQYQGGDILVAYRRRQEGCSSSTKSSRQRVGLLVFLLLANTAISKPVSNASPHLALGRDAFVGTKRVWLFDDLEMGFVFNVWGVKYGSKHFGELLYCWGEAVTMNHYPEIRGYSRCLKDYCDSHATSRWLSFMSYQPVYIMVKIYSYMQTAVINDEKYVSL